MSENSVLERGEWMLDRGSSQPHDLGRSALLHSLQSVVVQMSREEALRRSGTARFQRTASADLSTSDVDDRTIFTRELFTDQPLPLPDSGRYPCSPRSGSGCDRVASHRLCCCAVIQEWVVGIARALR